MQKRIIADTKTLLRDAWLGVVVNEDTIPNPILTIPAAAEEHPEQFFMWIMSRPEYFYLTCKVLLNIEPLIYQNVILAEMWNHKFPMLVGTRGLGKSWILAVYTLLRLLFLPNRKIVIAGAGFRQSKVIFQYIETIVNNSPILRDYLYAGGNNPFSKQNDEYSIRIGSSIASAIPIGTGDKIRGKRANDIIADEFASMLIDIFETVIAGFGAVSASPQKNVKRKAAEDLASRMGLSLKDLEEVIEVTPELDNQIIISGTAYYDFNHFAGYHKKWLSIIKSRGDKQKLNDIFGGDIQDALDWRDYSIIRVPYELIPKGYMSDAMIARSRATMHSGNYEMEYGAVFSKDSAGFYKRTLIEICTVAEDKRITSVTGRVYQGRDLFFEPKMRGDRNKEYVFGVDPAAMVDNFSIAILELDGEFRKIVHVWTTNKKDHTEKITKGLITEHNYYAYGARKIRELMALFPCVRIAMDSEGGGRAVMEQLRDKDKLLPNELPIYHIIDYNEPRPDEDGLAGLHIIDEIHFSSQEWTSNANHGMKKDMEDMKLLFPYIDGISMAQADYDDEDAVRNYDTMTQCIKDIEELKNELSTIIVTESKTGRESFDTPEVKIGTGKKGKLRKDRYSALLMANMTARTMEANPKIELDLSAGGFAGYGYARKEQPTGNLFLGPEFITTKLQQLYANY